MLKSLDIRKVAFLGDYLPRKCGIATFTTDLRCAVAVEFPAIQCLVVPVNDLAGGYDYPAEVRFEIAEQDLPSYLRAADFLNITDVDAVCLEHEFGIFGGPAGSHVLRLVRSLKMPVVTTLHTLLSEPGPDQRRVMQELLAQSTRLVVMSERGRELLRDVYQAPEAKIDLIPHGIPDMPFADPNYFKDEFGVAGKQVLLTFGLLSPNKGIEFALRALPDIIREFPNVVYIVLGQTHPNLLREEGEAYRLSLERLAKDLGVQKHVVFFNRFVELGELMRFIGAADIYLTPYLTEAQITSGTLAYAFGAGNAVVSNWCRSATRSPSAWPWSNCCGTNPCATPCGRTPTSWGGTWCGAAWRNSTRSPSSRRGRTTASWAGDPRPSKRSTNSPANCRN